MNTAIANSLQAWASRATPDELHAGPQAEDLGGWEAVAAAADSLAQEPLFRYLIDLSGNDCNPPNAEVRTQLDRAVLRGVAEHSRHSSYVSAITRLLASPSLITRLSRPLERALQRRAEAGATPGADVTTASIGATALQAWLYLCSSRAVREYHLLAFLTDLPDTVSSLPVPMAQALPKITGLAHEHFGDDELVGLLRQLLNVPDAEIDAGFELALADLRRALSADDEVSFAHSLGEARSGFAAVASADEARHDAQAYSAALDAIMAFGRSDPAPLRDATRRLETAIGQHFAWLSGNYLPTWSWTRTQAESAWLQLTAILTTAADTLHEPCWWHPGQAIAALLDVYKAGRSFTSGETPASRRGIGLLIQPSVEGAFIKDTNRLALLDHALAHDSAFSADTTAHQLHDAVHAALHRIHATGQPSQPDDGDDGLGKGISRLAAVTHHLGPAAADIIASMPQSLAERLDNALWNNEIARSTAGNIKVDYKLRELVQGLRASPDWPLAGGPFQALLHQTVLYLASRYDIGATIGGNRTAFLRNRQTGSVLERDLQQDYFDWLHQGPLYGAIAAEVINQSRGRVDILVRLGNASYSVECKRELTDASRDGLRAYLGQAAVYTNTNAALGILLVLDLTTPPTGAPDLFSSIWIEQVRREREDSPRYIVVARLPGNAPAPSATRTPARAQ